MMKDLKIKIKRDSSLVYFDKRVLGLNLENLQGNISFEFDTFVDGTGYLEVDYGYVHHYEYQCSGSETGNYEIQGKNKYFTMPNNITNSTRIMYYEIINKLVVWYDENNYSELVINSGTQTNKLNFEKKEKAYYKLTKNNQKYTLPIYNTLLLQKARLNMQLRVDEVGTAVFKSNTFYIDVLESLNVIDGDIPKEYPSWINIINNKLEASNIHAGENITITVSGNDITISGEDADSSVKDVKVNNISVVDSNKIANIDLTPYAKEEDIPTKTSDLTNDSGFIDNTYHDNTKQNTLVSGTNIKTINNQNILGSGNIEIQGGSSNVDDVKVDGVSVVTNKIANIDLTSYAKTSELGTLATKNNVNYETEVTNKPTIPTKTSDLTNDSNFVVDSSYVHTDNNYTNADKTKLDGIDLTTKEDVFRYNIMPTASASLLNKIVEYIGTTDSNYTNGYFYKCVDTSVQESITATQTDNVVPLGTITIDNSTFKSQASAGTHEFVYRPYDTVLNFSNISVFPPVMIQVTRDSTFDRSPMIPNAPRMYSWVDNNNNFYVTDTLQPNALTKLYLLDIQTNEATDTGTTFISSNTPSQIEGRWTKKDGDVYTDVEISDYGILLSSAGLPGNTIQVVYVEANTSYSWQQHNVQPAGSTGANIDLNNLSSTGESHFVKPDKIKTSLDTTSGNIYDVTYINSVVGNIQTLLEEI